MLIIFTPRLSPVLLILTALTTSALAQFCASGTLTTFTNPGLGSTDYYCCPEGSLPIDNVANGASSCYAYDFPGHLVYVCNYNGPSNTPFKFQWPADTTSLFFDMTGGWGDSIGDVAGGASQILTGPLDTGSFTDNTAYLYVGAFGGTGIGGANGGGFTSVGASSATDSTRLAVAGGGGGAGSSGATSTGGNAGTDTAADGGASSSDGDYGGGASRLYPGVYNAGTGPADAGVDGDGPAGGSPGSVTITVAASACVPATVASGVPAAKRKRQAIKLQQEYLSDCLAMPGVNNVGCVDGECVAYSCLPGHALDANTCQLSAPEEA
ncbi:beta and beta-prime subunits of DNA dependent RNA-polymerase [Pseudohyphozyma bogoriensis]|nr:beta and beta-prime subunits of DNA dependent RNA-polymerase [Pseudohyphozyma bogoriensis]